MDHYGRFLPPGYSARRMWIACALHLMVFAVFQIVFLVRYKSALSNLNTWASMVNWSVERGRMPDLDSLTAGCLYWYPILASIMITITGTFYRYFYKESRSIWLMRRLPDRWELHIRCLTVPLAILLAGAVLCAVQLAIYRYVYITFTPPECVGDSNISIWRALFGIGGTTR